MLIGFILLVNEQNWNCWAFQVVQQGSNLLISEARLCTMDVNTFADLCNPVNFKLHHNLSLSRHCSFPIWYNSIFYSVFYLETTHDVVIPGSKTVMTRKALQPLMQNANLKHSFTVWRNLIFWCNPLKFICLGTLESYDRAGTTVTV